MGKRHGLILAIVLVSACIPDAAHACSCDRLAACAAFWTSDVVFIGRAERVVKKPGGAQEARLVVDEWLRGQRAGSELTILSYGVGGSCDFGFDEGTRYLVHATKRAGRWAVSLCGGTAPVAEATADLKYIRDALAHPGDGTLSGSAFVDIDPGEGVKTGPPIANARLLLRSSSGRELTTQTGKEGNYRFEAVPAGEYALVVQLPSGHEPVPPKRIVVGRGACLRHVFWTMKR